MVSVALPLPAVPDCENARGLLRPAPLPHPPEAMDGIPYYDEELDMAQSDAHMQTILCLGPLLNRVAKAAGLRGVSDYPIWYMLPERHTQRPLYPDYAFTAHPSIAALTANQLLLALEVVTTSHVAKEQKDTVRMRDYNEAHGVPEFMLLYPEPDDPRSVIWYRRDAATGRYRELPPPADGRYRSTAIPGLEIEVLPRAEWALGRKVRVWFRGEELRDGETEAQARAAAERQTRQERQARAAERQARAAAEQRANHEAQRANHEAQRANHEAQRAAQLAKRLRALGIDPDASE